MYGLVAPDNVDLNAPVAPLLGPDPAYQDKEPPGPVAQARGGNTPNGVIPHTPSDTFTEETGLTPDQYDTFRGYLAHRESQRYDEPPNREGYMGRYQMGPQEIMESAAREGIPHITQQEFLADPELQERLFENYTLDHHRQLMQHDFYSEAPPEQRAQFLAGAHLGGVGGVSHYMSGDGSYDPSDSNGTHISDYVTGMGQEMRRAPGHDQFAGPGASQPEVGPVVPPKAAPRMVGPFQSEFDAYSAAPKDRDNYTLQDGPNGTFFWEPKMSMQKGLLANPNANPLYSPQQTSKIVNQSVVNGPHSWTDPISSFVGTMGQAFTGATAGLLDLPFWVADRGYDAIRAGIGDDRAPYHYGTPVRDWLNKIGFDTERARLPDTDPNKWAADMGYGIGSGLGMVLPMLAGGVGASALEGSEAGGGSAGAIVRTMSGYKPEVPVSSTLQELGIGGAAGLGQEEAHEMYKSATGREGDLGDIATQLLGGGAWNAIRLPLISHAEDALIGGAKSLVTGFKRGWEGVKAGKADNFGPEQLTQPVDAQSGQKIADGVLTRKFIDARNEAEAQVAALGGRAPEDAASYIADRSMAARAAVAHWADTSAKAEDHLLSQVNPDLPRDFTATKGLYAQMKGDYAAAGPHVINDWPKELDSTFARDTPAQPAPGTPGAPQFVGNQLAPPSQGLLANFDTFGAGWGVYRDLNRLIERTMASGGIPINEQRLGYLQKVRNQLGQDLNGSEGSSFPEIDAMRQLRTFSDARQQILESPEMKGFLSSALPDAKALDKLLKQGPEGADAVKIMVGAAQSKFGEDGLLAAAQDVLRQKYSNSVAPNGYISLDAHNKFMNRYGGILDHPTMQDVKNQFNQAASAEGNLNNIVGFGKPGGFGNTSGMIERRVDAMETYLNAPMETIMRHLEGVSNAGPATARVISQLQGANDAGAALAGFQHVVAKRGLDQGADWLNQNQDILRAIDTVNPGFTARLQKYTDPSTKAGIAKHLGDWALSYLGARFGSALSEGLNMGGGMVMASRGASTMRALGDKLKEQLTQISSANIVDPEADAAWGRILSGGIGGARQTALDKLLLHSYVPGMAIGNLPTRPMGNPGDPGTPVQQQVDPWLQQQLRGSSPNPVTPR